MGRAMPNLTNKPRGRTTGGERAGPKKRSGEGKRGGRSAASVEVTGRGAARAPPRDGSALHSDVIDPLLGDALLQLRADLVALYEGVPVLMQLLVGAVVLLGRGEVVVVRARLKVEHHHVLLGDPFEFRDLLRRGLHVRAQERLCRGGGGCATRRKSTHA